MRIAVIVRSFSRAAGGAESYAVALVQQLAGHHDIHVFAQRTDYPVLAATYHRVVCFSQKPRWLNQLVFATATWWQTRRGFDVVHSHENTWHGQVQTIHVRPLRFNLFRELSGFGKLLRWLKVSISPRLLTYVVLEGARFMVKPGRLVVATSDILREQCEQTYPQCRNLIRVITPGTVIPEARVSRQSARQQLGLAPEEPIVLFVANDYARKGLDALLKAITLLPDNVNLAIVGNPKPIPHYRKLAERLGVQDRVHFLGSVKSLETAYFAADCLAHPTLEDTFAMVVLEAMAHGLPVVVSGPAFCGVSALLSDGTNAMLLEQPTDSVRLAELIEAVLEKKALASRLGTCGLEFAKQHSWSAAALKYEDIYLELASTH